MSIRIGNFKKFKLLNGDEFVGVVVGLDNSLVEICTVKGAIVKLRKSSFEVATTRLDLKVRGVLTEIGKEYLKLRQYRKE